MVWKRSTVFFNEYKVPLQASFPPSGQSYSADLHCPSRYLRNTVAKSEEAWEGHRASRVSSNFSSNIQPNFDREYLSARFHERISSIWWGYPRGHVLFDIEGHLYFFKFSDDGRYLLFRDQDCRDGEVHSNITVLEVIDSELGLWSLVTATTRQSPSLTAYTSSRSDLSSLLEEVLYKEAEIAFHFSEALLLIQCSR